MDGIVDFFRGTEIDVLKSLNFEHYKPQLICVEIHEKEIELSKIYRFLVDKKYELIWSGVFSYIFKRLQN